MRLPLLGSPASDPRLKRNVQRIPGLGGRGIHWYAFEWNPRAERVYGLRGAAHGPLASEVRRVLPRAVIRNPDTGYDHVDLDAVLRYVGPPAARSVSVIRRARNGSR